MHFLHESIAANPAEYLTYMCARDVKNSHASKYQIVYVDRDYLYAGIVENGMVNISHQFIKIDVEQMNRQVPHYNDDNFSDTIQDSIRHYLKARRKIRFHGIENVEISVERGEVRYGFEVRGQIPGHGELRAEETSLFLVTNRNLEVLSSYNLAK